MSRQSGTTLYVRGFGHGTRALDLAREFERYGRLVRCDIPAPRTQSSSPFAFVEYESRRDADDAYHEMHNKPFSRDDILKVEWAKNTPSSSWRFEQRDRRRDRGYGRYDRERSPPRRRSRSPPPRSRDYSPRGDRRDRDYSPRGDRRDRDYSPRGDRRDRDYDRRDRGSDRDHDRDRERDREPAGRTRSRTPEDNLRDRDMKDAREGQEDEEPAPAAPAANGDDAEDKEPPRAAEDELDTAE